jgi:hypothetical protein
MSSSVKVIAGVLLAVAIALAVSPAKNGTPAPVYNPAPRPMLTTGLVQPGSGHITPTDAILLQESFDGTAFPPPGWTRIITDTSHTNGIYPAHWDTFGVTYPGTLTPHTAPRCAGMWWSWNTQQEWLITPSIALTGGTSYQLEWWTYGYRGSINGDHFYTKISTDGGSTWTALFDMSALTPPDTGWDYWTAPYQLDLTSYAGQTVKIAWHADDGTGGPGVWYAWGVDDITVSSSGGGPSGWLYHSSLPYGYMDHAAISANGYVYVPGGYSTSADSGKAVVRGDLSMHTWSTQTSLPMPLCNGGAGIIGDTLYVCGGYSYRPVSTVDTLFKYSFNGNNWTGAPGPFTSTTYNWSPTVVTCAGKLYYISGCNVPGATAPTTQCWAYTPGTGWASIANMNQGRVFAQAAVYHDTIWVMGGNANEVELTHTEFYAPATNTWTVNNSIFPQLPIPLWAAASGVSLGQFFVAAGATGGNFSPMSYFYTPSAHAWTDSVPVLTSVYRTAGCGNSRDEAMIVGGDQGGFTGIDTVQYIPSAAVSEGTPARAYNLRLAVSPNPARGPVAVRFNLPRPGYVSAGIFDLNGRLVRTLSDAALAPGFHELSWNHTDNRGRTVRSGTYLCRVMMNGASVSIRAVVVE